MLQLVGTGSDGVCKANSQTSNSKAANAETSNAEATNAETSNAETGNDETSNAEAGNTGEMRDTITFYQV